MRPIINLGNACRSKVLNTLRKNSPKEAEGYYFSQKVAAPEVLATVADSELSVGQVCAAPGLLSSTSHHEQQLDLISELLYHTVQSDISPSDDFLNDFLNEIITYNNNTEPFSSNIWIFTFLRSTATAKKLVTW